MKQVTLKYNKYVTIKGGPAPKTEKATVQKPTVKPVFKGKTFGKSGRGSLREDLGLV